MFELLAPSGLPAPQPATPGSLRDGLASLNVRVCYVILYCLCDCVIQSSVRGVRRRLARGATPRALSNVSCIAVPRRARYPAVVPSYLGVRLYPVARPGPGSVHRRPVVGAHFARAVCPGSTLTAGAGRLTFVVVFNVFCPLARRHNCHALSSRAAALQVQGARSAAAAASVCTGGNAAIARSALCGVCKVRECVYQPRVDAPRGRNSHGRRRRAPACPGHGPGSTRGRASLDPRMSRVRHSL